MSGRSYGQAGKGLGGEAATQKYGKNAAAGAYGERYLDGAFQRDDRISGYTVWKSLGVPRSASGKKYQSDVDFAIASGNKLILVDAKMWSAGKIYWRFFGKVYAGLEPMGGKLSEKKISRNMEMARELYQGRLPGGIKVKSIVVFVPVKGGRLPQSVIGLIWPGGIRSYLPGDGIRKIRRYLGTPKPVNEAIEALAGEMTK